MLADIQGYYFLALGLILVSIGFLFLGVYTLLADTKSAVRRKYIISACFLAIWSLGYALMLISGNEATAQFFWSFGFVASTLFFPSWIHFLIGVTGYKRKIKFLMPLLYVTAIVISGLGVASGDVVLSKTSFGFLYSLSANPIFQLWAGYALLVYVLMAFFHLYWWYTAKKRHEKKQLMRYNLFTFIIGPPSLFFDFAAPAFFDISFIPIGTPLILIISLQLSAILRTYHSMSISVKNVSEDMFKSIALPILLLDDKNCIVHLNNAAIDALGDGHIMKNASCLFLVDGQPPEQSFFTEASSNTTLSVQMQSEIRICRIILKVLKNKHGDLYSKIMILHDITEISSALVRAEEASRAKSDFLSRMSHEMRTPMTAIIGMVNIGKYSKDSTKIEYCLEKIDEASKHLLGLINDILDMSKIEANMVQINETVFDLENLAERALSIVAVKAEEKNHKLSVNIDPAIPNRLIGDDLWLFQVITNFMSNAVKFTPEGGTIKLNISLIAHKLIPHTTGGELTIRVEVVDNGIGINPEHHQKLFSSFEQAESSIHRKFGGTGLGLAISKNVIELMGGSIGVESEEGKGSCFYFTVNVSIADSDSSHNENISDSPTLMQEMRDLLSGKVILLTEDIEINREIVTALLEDTGIILDYAVNGEIAVEKFKSEQDKYDLIFMDIQMPVMDGLEATRQIRAIGTTQAKNIPIIAMTANAFEEDVENCKKAGMNDHVSKPIDFGELISKLNTCLSSNTSD